MKYTSKRIIYNDHGDPRKMLQMDKIEIDDTKLGRDEVLVKWLASPVNPLDINKVEGKYPFVQGKPAVAGSEGVAIVLKTGSTVKSLKKGDQVVSFGLNTPIWNQYAVVCEEGLYKVRSDLDVASACTIMINPPTAYIMLKHFVDLVPGDYVIQNSANSAVGRCVIEMASAMHLKSINIVRDRPNIAKLKAELKALGADHVFTEEEFAKDNVKFIKSLPNPPRLAMNGVGGRSNMIICAALGFGGTLVTYGAMGKKPIEILSSSFIFKDLKAYGVAVGPWMKMHPEKADKIMKVIQEMLVKGEVSPPPMEEVKIDDYASAIDKQMRGGHKKQLLVLHEDVQTNMTYKSKL
ncbi:hypothetical protein L596_006409 [Steinernema carpocapsae]|uniref:Enoyl-[acyl-carrier-protein] reductase, mitochondrial n=1 Tax=Steinernema carpocapsae TaxID=34508 RepID=A0A4U8V278_STECR|nr:hypothetical protein L596_006409 [Steinernema carpocapsae]